MGDDLLSERLSKNFDGEELRVRLEHAALLPSYATAWERRIATMTIGASAIDEAIAVLRTLHDPATCPAEWLFLLAWDFSVDIWDDDWPEHIKRRVCLAYWNLHRYKGTRFAIRTALEAIGLDPEFTAWFEEQPEGPRGSFHVTCWPREFIYPDEPFLGVRTRRIAHDAASGAKMLTRPFSLSLGLQARSGIALASIGQTKARATATATSHQAVQSRSRLRCGSQGIVAASAEASVRSSQPLHARSDLSTVSCGIAATSNIAFITTSQSVGIGAGLLHASAVRTKTATTIGVSA